MIHRLAGLSNWPNPLTAFALKQAVRKPRLSCAIAGTILLTAAATKVYGLTTDPAAAFGDIASPSIRILVIELEMFLGMWLLSGGTQLVSWALGILTFTSFAG